MLVGINIYHDSKTVKANQTERTTVIFTIPPQCHLGQGTEYMSQERRKGSSLQNGFELGNFWHTFVMYGSCALVFLEQDALPPREETGL